jgi:lipid-binding SYLF domain-containing protein
MIGHCWTLTICLVLALLAHIDCVVAQVMVQPSPAEVTVVNATNVFAQAMVMPGNSIPRGLISQAQGIAIVPGMVRGAFVVGVQHGRGVLVVRDGQGNWQAPRMIQITGGSIGYQIGIQATDLVLIFRTPQSVANLLAGTIKVGVDASAAAGPVGRQTSAATDLRLQAEILSYSRARGAFVGVSIDGSSISLDPAAEAMYYQPPGTMPASGMQLLQTIAAYSATLPVAATTGQAASAAASGAAWVPQGASEMEVARRQLDLSTRKLSATLDASWRQYLSLPAEVYVPNAAISPPSIQPALARYEDVAKRSEFAALQARPEFQDALQALRRLSEVRTATNTSLNLPPPPGNAISAGSSNSPPSSSQNQPIIPR